MRSDDVLRMLGMAFLVLLAALSVKAALRSRKEQTRAKEELERPYEEPPLEEIPACVYKKTCGAEVHGTKSPQMCRRFTITFRTGRGELLAFPVEEVYAALEEGREGTLAVVNGSFYGFAPEDGT